LKVGGEFSVIKRQNFVLQSFYSGKPIVEVQEEDEKRKKLPVMTESLKSCGGIFQF